MRQAKQSQIFLNDEPHSQSAMGEEEKKSGKAAAVSWAKKMSYTKVSNSSEETEAIGREIAALLPEKGLISLEGDLGAGKTTLVKGIVSALTGLDTHEIHSPTFTYLHIYEGTRTVHHFDCYRLENGEDFLNRGLDDYLEGLCLIEWPGKIPSLLLNEWGKITIDYEGEGKRRICL